MLNLKVVNAITDLGKTKRGGSSSRFIECDDGKEYVVKFTTIQGPKLFLNEFIGTFTSKLLSCSTPDLVLVKFNQAFIESFPEFNTQNLKKGVYPGIERIGNAFDLCTNPKLPSDIHNVDSLIPMIVYDNWVVNIDRNNCGNLILANNDGMNKIYQIDNGHIFGGPSWDENKLKKLVEVKVLQPILPAISEYVKNGMKMLQSIKKLENISPESIMEILANIPEEWQHSDAEKNAVKETLLQRKKIVGSVVLDNKGKFKNCSWEGI